MVKTEKAAHPASFIFAGEFVRAGSAVLGLVHQTLDTWDVGL
jgi:hypothetical protein